jgi:hypothetical protein
VQVIIMSIASVFGLITCVAQISVLIAQATGKQEEEHEE